MLSLTIEACRRDRPNDVNGSHSKHSSVRPTFISLGTLVKIVLLEEGSYAHICVGMPWLGVRLST